MREDKKKKRADDKKAEEEKKKKSDQEKAAANSVTISPPSTNDDDAPIDLEDDTMSLNFDEETTTQTDGDWTEAEDDEALARLGISPNHRSRRDNCTKLNTNSRTQCR